MTKNATSLPLLTLKKDNYLKKNRKTVARILGEKEEEEEQRSVQTLRSDLLELKKPPTVKKNSPPKFKIIGKTRLASKGRNSITLQKYNSGKIQIKSKFFKVKEEEKQKVDQKSMKPEMIPVKSKVVKRGGR